MGPCARCRRSRIEHHGIGWRCACCGLPCIDPVAGVRRGMELVYKYTNGDEAVQPEGSTPYVPAIFVQDGVPEAAERRLWGW
jgi:hypothetical protein